MRISAFSGFTTVAVLTLSLFGAGVAMAHEYRAGEIEIGHPWSRATPPGAKVAAGYLTLKNSGSQADRLVSATMELSGRSEIHEMAVGDDGVMTMRPLQDGLEVPAGSEVSLKPGGHHIMFLDLKEPLTEGQRIKGKLTFENAGVVEVEFAVEAMGSPKEQTSEKNGAEGHHAH